MAGFVKYCETNFATNGKTAKFEIYNINCSLAPFDDFKLLTLSLPPKSYPRN